LERFVPWSKHAGEPLLGAPFEKQIILVGRGEPVLDRQWRRLSCVDAFHRRGEARLTNSRNSDEIPAVRCEVVFRDALAPLTEALENGDGSRIHRVVDANGMGLAYVYGQPDGSVGFSDSRLRPMTSARNCASVSPALAPRYILQRQAYILILLECFSRPLF